MSSVALLGAAGWMTALGLALTLVRLRRRLALVALAAHELRGPVTAFAFATAALRREPGGLRRALAFEAELERMKAGLSDLERARSGHPAPRVSAPVGVDRLARRSVAGWRPAAHGAGRRLRFRWEGGPATVRGDSGRLSQAFGNLLANAVEHGRGPVEVRGVREGESVRVEVRNAGPVEVPVGSRPGHGRGLGLSIAGRAVEDAGGRLTVEHGADGSTVASVELPVADP